MTLNLRRPLILMLRATLALLAVWLLAGVAWLASNAVDSRAEPLPATLALWPNQPGSALFYTVQGVLAPAGQSPEAAGRREWQHAVRTGHTLSDTMAWPRPVKGLPLDCRAPQDCAGLLAGSLPQLAAQLAPAALLGQRCSAGLEGDQRFEENLPQRLHAASPLPNYIGGVQCALWFSGQAVLSAARADKAGSLQRLQQGRRLADAMLSGCRMLICKMVGVRLAEAHFDAISAVARLKPAWAAELVPLLQPLPPQALQARDWLAAEFAVWSGSLDDILTDCGNGMDALLFGTRLRAVDWLSQLGCKTHIGLLPNATRQRMVRHWIGRYGPADDNADGALDRAIASRRAGDHPSDAGWAWRNTLGARFVDTVGSAAYDEYFARQADADLRRVALLTAVSAQAQRVPLAERAAWLQRQDLAARQRTRLQWIDGGAQLQVRPWLAELNPGTPRAADYRLAAAL